MGYAHPYPSPRLLGPVRRNRMRLPHAGRGYPPAAQGSNSS
jgi:hypothetical protein